MTTANRPRLCAAAPTEYPAEFLEHLKGPPYDIGGGCKIDRDSLNGRAIAWDTWQAARQSMLPELLECLPARRRSFFWVR